MLIHLEKLGKSFGEKIVLHDVTASVEREDRIGIVGQNGAGKTTLLKILTGEYQDYEGEFSVTHGVTLGYLEQNAKLDATLDLYGEMRSTFAPVLDAMAQMQVLERKMAAQPDDTELLARHDQLQNIVDAADGYNMDVNIKKVLSGMGFAQDTWQKNIAVLSGGELTRLRLAKLLLEKPDVLILDEPTSQLDPIAASTFLHTLRKLNEELGLTILLFFLLPTFLAGFIDPYIKSAAVHNLVESVIKLVIFFAYMILCSKQKDIYRVFQYHGAEHKTIFCYEAGLPLTVENCRIQPRHHPRCGTSFLFVVVVVSILVSSLVFSFVNWRNMWVRMALHLLLLIPIVGVTYEFNRYVGGHDNKVTRFLARPGLWLQNFTTNEPDDSMLEVAIRALELVIPEEKGKDAW